MAFVIKMPKAYSALLCCKGSLTVLKVTLDLRSFSKLLKVVDNITTYHYIGGLSDTYVAMVFELPFRTMTILTTMIKKLKI